MSNPLDSGGNVQVDHVWGNIPMQPDDARGENTLDPALDNHIIAVTGYNGFPAYIPNTPPYDDTVPNVLVPNVVGETEGDAEDAIEAAGLELGTVTTANNAGGATEENDGTVKSQSPAAGTKVNEGTSVNLVVYAYVIPTVEVPNVVGETQSDAEDAIEEVGLVVGDVTTAGNDGGATEENDGTVKTQDPAAATTVNVGTEVDLVVYEYTTTTVPDVVGDNEATATSAIEAADLVVGTVTTSTDGATEGNDGTVKSQNPAAASTVATGSAVDLVLYEFTG